VRILALLSAAWLSLQADGAADLRRMAATERAFAAATKEIGVRDGFLTFFSDDAIDVAPVSGRLELIKAKDRLRAQPPAGMPLVTQLLWDPRWGGISSGGDLGWLTGPYRIRSTRGADPDRHGAYFSIWRRQADRTYKVRLDIGISTPEEATFPEGFTTATPPVAPPPSAQIAADADRTVRAIETRFAASASKGLSEAYRSHVLADARLHRNERAPMVGAAAVGAFMASSFDHLTWVVLHAEMAESGDLAFSAGSYAGQGKSSEGHPGTPERGFFVRVWHRDTPGAWKIAFETNGIR
jgi:ketosteroid isomerase-like protein